MGNVLSGSMRDRLNHWGKLEYHDPAVILRRLRALEIEISGLKIDPQVLRLRTQELKKYREWRDAAVFCYGIGLVQGWSIMYATEERSDYDFVTRWHVDTETFFCPVQLKELPPADLNPTVSIEQILRGSSKVVRKSSTVLAVKLNRRDQLDLTNIAIPSLPWQQLWFFWSMTPDASRWALYGDAFNAPGQFEFEYPE